MAAKRKPAPAKSKVKPKSKKKRPSPDPKQAAMDWFSNLSARVHEATVAQVQALIAEARTYDLVGLEQLLGDHDQVLAINRAANQLIDSGLKTFGAASPVGFQLQVLRDILNDS